MCVRVCDRKRKKERERERERERGRERERERERKKFQCNISVGVENKLSRHHPHLFKKLKIFSNKIFLFLKNNGFSDWDQCYKTFFLC